VKVWDFEFGSLEFVCYLGFMICNFHQLAPQHTKNEDESNPKFAIRNFLSPISRLLAPDSLLYAPCSMPRAQTRWQLGPRLAILLSAFLPMSSHPCFSVSPIMPMESSVYSIGI